MKKILGIILVAAILLPSVSVSAKAGQLPGGWYCQSAGGAQGSAVVTDEKAHSGKNSLVITNNTPYAANRYLNTFTRFNVKEGKKYEFGCYAKGTGVDAVAMSVDWTGRVGLNPFSNFDWMEFKSTYISTKNGQAEFQFLLDSIVKKLYIDDLYVYELDENGKRTGDNLITKTGFEDDDSDVVIPTVVMTESEKKLADIQEKGISASGTLDSVYHLFSAVPMFDDNINIDGDNNDWSDIYAIHLPNENSLNTIKDYGGEADCALDFKTAYDENNFYLLAERTDNTDVNDLDEEAKNEILLQEMKMGAGGDIFNPKLYYVDSIQFAVSDGTATYEFGIAYPENKIKCFTGNLSDEQLAKISASVSKVKTDTKYEIAIPWTVLFDTDKILFDIRVNDNDGSGKFGSIQWAGSMDRSIDVSKCRTLKKQQRDFFQITEEPMEEKEATVTMNYKYYLINNTGEDKTYALNLSGNEKEITIPASNVYFENVPVVFSDGGEKTMVFTAMDKATGDERTDTFVYEIADSYVAIEKYKKQLDNMINVKLPELIALRDELNGRGITTQYEDMTIAVCERQIEYQYSDIEQKALYTLRYNVDAIDKMLDDTKAKLISYKNGEKTPRTVPNFKTSYVTRDGVSEYAQDETGKIRPVFFIGYGHFDAASRDISNFNSFGADMIQRELPLHDTIKINTEGEFYVDGAYIRMYDSLLTNADNSNVQFDILLPMHYIQYISGINRFEDYNSINHPIRKEILSLFYEAVVPVMAKHKSLHSFCISNEPYYRLTNCAYDLEYYRNWLKNWYNGDIETLNRNYGSAYTDFFEITIPDDWFTSRWALCEDPATWTENDLNRYIDWMDASCQSFADYHEWMANEVRKYASDVPLHSKIQASFLSEDEEWARHYFLSGINYEMMYDIFDINGNDACNFGRSQEILDKLQWYDYQTSFKNAPVFNSEDHIVLDGDKTFNDTYKNRYYSDMWQGAIHGRAITTIWLWQRSHTDATVIGNVLHRPDCVEAVGRSYLDLNRLGYEVTALQNADRDVAIYYDYDARIKSGYLLNAQNLAYASITYSGLRAEYVTPNKVMAGELEDYKAIVIPETLNMDNEILAEFVNYAKKGGKVIIIGRNTFTKQRYSEPVDESLRNFLFENSVVVDTEHSTENGYLLTAPTVEQMFEIFYNEFDKMGLLDVKVIDNETGKPVFGVEINETVYEGKHLINMCNYYDNTVKNVSIYINGEEIVSATDKIAEEPIDTTSIELHDFEPVFISVG